MMICETISEQLRYNATHHADDIWLTSPETEVSYSWSDTYIKAQQIAHSLLSNGVEKGESVAIASPNS